MGCFIQMADAYGYGKFDICSTLGYFSVCHDSWRRILTSGLWVRAKGLCLLEVNNTHHIGWDCKLCDFACLVGPTFQHIVVGRTKWSDMEGPCV
jgi:hypothetical protein